MNNVLLAVGLPAVAYVWARHGFAIPGQFISQHRRRQLLAAAGYIVILITAAYVIGGAIGGQTQIAKSPRTLYAHRDREPARFWRQLVLDAAMGLAVGVPFVLLARRRSTSSAVTSNER